MSNAEVIKSLNIILKNELTAINQYFLHAKMAEHQGLTKLHAEMYKESIDEMKHADALTTRILFLGGLPNLQNLGKLMIGETPKEMLENDLKLEDNALKDLREAHKVADEAADVGSITLLEEIINSEEQHQDWLKRQLSLIEALGIENYLQTQV